MNQQPSERSIRAERALEAADLGLEAVDQVQRRLDAAGLGAVADDQPGAVDRLPDLDGERGARGAGIVARGGEAGADRARIVLGKGEVAAHVGRAEALAAGARRPRPAPTTASALRQACSPSSWSPSAVSRIVASTSRAVNSARSM